MQLGVGIACFGQHLGNTFKMSQYRLLDLAELMLTQHLFALGEYSMKLA